MRTVETTAAGAFRVRFRYGQSKKTGAPKQCSETFETEKQATDFAAWIDILGVQGALDRLYDGEQQAGVPSLDTVAADHIRLLTGIERGTRLRYTQLWERTWAPALGFLPANMVGPDQVRAAVNDLGQRYSRKSLENQRGLLSGVLNRVVELGLLPKNPAKGIRLPRGQEGDRVEMRLLTPDEFASVLKRLDPHYRSFVLFLAGTGARWGEAVALDPTDVAIPNVRIRRALKWSPDGERTIGATKTKKSNRTIALPTELHDVLTDLARGKKKGEQVFTAKRGGMILHRTFWSRYWLPAVEHLVPRPRIHDLRHSHISWLLAAGVPINVVQARAGHESIQTTVDTYGHLLPDAQLAASTAASAVFRLATPRPQLED